MGQTVQEETFESIWSEWERILPSCSTNTVFVTPWWQKVWWDNFCADNELRLLSVREGQEIIGIASLMISDGKLTFTGDKELFDYFDFLVPKGNEAKFYETLFDHIMEMDWQSIDLPSLPQASSACASVRACPSCAGPPDIRPMSRASTPPEWFPRPRPRPPALALLPVLVCSPA